MSTTDTVRAAFDSYLAQDSATAERRLVRAGDEGVFILCEYELKTGERHRNTEFITDRDGQLVETQVLFGGRVPHR